MEKNTIFPNQTYSKMYMMKYNKFSKSFIIFDEEKINITYEQ
jgi:hypothetical protein